MHIARPPKTQLRTKKVRGTHVEKHNGRILKTEQDYGRIAASFELQEHKNILKDGIAPSNAHAADMTHNERWGHTSLISST